MSMCVNCGRPIRQTDGGTWVHDASGRGICSWAEPGEPQEHAARWDGKSRPHLCATCGARVVSRLESWVHVSGEREST